MKQKSGFTLIEMSIVLIVIGLIVGGILTGRDLINVAAQRAQVTQIQKYNTAVNTFRNKYGGLPGDLGVSPANQFGFQTGGCDGTQGLRDSNGILEGWSAGNTLDEFLGENGLFWEDLSQAVLIEGTFPNSGAAARNCTPDATQITLASGPYNVVDFIPSGKLGYGTFVYTYSYNGSNYYGLSVVTNTNAGTGWCMFSNPAIPVIAAYNIDKKIDDGLPASGNINVNYNSCNATIRQAPSAGSPSSTTCFDTTSNQYSIGITGGNNFNCALSFKFQ